MLKFILPFLSLVVNTSAVDCLERLIVKTSWVGCRTLLTHLFICSLTGQLWLYALRLPTFHLFGILLGVLKLLFRLVTSSGMRCIKSSNMSAELN